MQKYKDIQPALENQMKQIVSMSTTQSLYGINVDTTKPITPSVAQHVMSVLIRNRKPWVGVDLDGTLVVHKSGDFDPMVVGEPIPDMINRVKYMIEQGMQVRIFTARVCNLDDHRTYEVAANIMNWTLETFGQVLAVTSVKDYCCVQIWDDRAVSVACNTGQINNQQLDVYEAKKRN